MGQSQQVASSPSGTWRGVLPLQLLGEVLGLTGQMKPFVPANGPFLAVTELPAAQPRSSSAAAAITLKCFY